MNPFACVTAESPPTPCTAAPSWKAGPPSGAARAGRAAVAILAIGFALAGCGGRPAPPDPGDVAPAVQRVEPAARAPEFQGDSRTLSLPTRITSSERLGTRPEGVGLAPGARLNVLPHDKFVLGVPTMAGLLEQGPLLVLFYRGGWCPYCNHQLHELMYGFEALRSLGVMPVAISADGISAVSRTLATFEFPFPVLSDPDLKAHALFRVALHLTESELVRLVELGIDIEAASGRQHHTIAVPSVFIVNRDAEVVWSHADLDYRTRPSFEQLVEVLEALPEERLFPPLPETDMDASDDADGDDEATE